MSAEDRSKWDQRYREGTHTALEPSSFLLSLDDVLPRRGRALDVAGGAGRHAIWLAARGLDVTLTDISAVGLRQAEAKAAAAGVAIRTMARDLEATGLPEGPWDLIVDFYFLQRSLFEAFPRVLAPGGLLVFAQPTRSNLERHARPPATHLLEDGELPGLIHALDVLRYEEGWHDEGRHEARLVASRAGGARSDVRPHANA